MGKYVAGFHKKYAIYSISDIKFVLYAFELPSVYAF